MDLYRQNGGAPETLPSVAYDAAGNAWSDLASSEEARRACGFVRAPPVPDYDALTQGVRWGATNEAWEVFDFPTLPEPLPDPEPAPVILGKGEFYDLVRSSGVTFAQIKAASDDPALAEFWFALNNFYSQIRRDHPSTRQGLAAMVALGHVEQGQADAVFASWPVAGGVG